MRRINRVDTVSPSSRHPVPTIALIGNPNTGKSTLFGALVGVHQRVGNYPGVTVEKTTGRMEQAGQIFQIIDLPGLYSLAPRSRDEMVAVDLLLGHLGKSSEVDAIVCIVDGSNLRRNLYLVSQVLDLGLPTVVALNMLDVAEEYGITIDHARLQEALGVPVVPIQANRHKGLDRLKAALAEAIQGERSPRPTPFPPLFDEEVDRIAARLNTSERDSARRWLAERLLLDSGGYIEKATLQGANGDFACELEAARQRLAKNGCAVPGVETASRYAWADRLLDEIATQPEVYRTTFTDRIDQFMTHRFWGGLFFALMMLLVFQSVFVWAEPAMGWIEAAIGVARAGVEGVMPAGALRSLLVDGVLGGVGGVLVFLPQIIVLFFFIAVLEDCGYMARAAYLMDRLMARVGLSGRSFIPMLSSFACSVPGIMATRVIPDRRDRFATILAIPFLTCSARLPVYALLIAAFIPKKHYLGGYLNLQGLTLAGLYLLGILSAVLVALVLKRTVLRAATPSFLLELPSYKWPSPWTILLRVYDRAALFLRCAGTMILLVSILVWAALYFPHDETVVEAPFRAERDRLEARLAAVEPGSPGYRQTRDALTQLDREILGAYQRQSILGRMGHWIEPVVRPLGWDWRIGCAVLASFPAREMVVATLGVIYNLGNDVELDDDAGASSLKSRLRNATWDGTDRPVFNIPVALSIMVFFALCAQCAATLVIIKNETNSWLWPLASFAYMTVLAYLGALVTYQVGMWVGG